MNLWEHKKQHHIILCQKGNHKQAIKTSEQKKTNSERCLFRGISPYKHLFGWPKWANEWLLSLYHSTSSVPTVVKNKDHLEPPPTSPIWGISYASIYLPLVVPNRASLVRRDGQIPPREDSVSIPRCLHGLLRHGPRASLFHDEKNWKKQRHKNNDSLNRGSWDILPTQTKIH